MTLDPHESASSSPSLDWGGLLTWPSQPRLEAWRRMTGADMDVEEWTEAGQLVVRAMLPGLDPDEDLDVSVGGGTLRIRAKRRVERCPVRTMACEFPLPSDVREDDVRAVYGHGVLEVRAPRAGERREFDVPIARR